MLACRQSEGWVGDQHVPSRRPDALALQLLFASFPIALAMTCGLVAVPVQTLRDRTRRPIRQPGTAVCLAAAVAFCGVFIHALLYALINPRGANRYYPYTAVALFDCVKWCGLGVLCVAAVLVLTGRCRAGSGAFERIRLALGGYWIWRFSS